MKSFYVISLWLLTEIVFVSGLYKTTFLEDICGTPEIAVWNLGSGNSNSSGILKASRDGKFLRSLNCTVLIQPPLGYGVVLSVRFLDFMPFFPPRCRNYVQIFEDDKSPKLCGFSDDMSEYQSYSSRGKGLQIQIITDNQTSPAFQSRLEFVATSYFELNYDCDPKMFRCDNSRCIWKSLTCDGHNNCGDRSDEYSSRRSGCGVMSPGVIAAIVVGSVMCFLLMIIIPITCCRCKSRSRTLQGSIVDPALMHPPSYGTSAARSALYDSGSTRNTIQEQRSLQEPSSSNGRYSDPPPAYKAN